MEACLALRRKGGADVDHSLNFAACTVVFRDGGIEHVVKLQIESYEFVTNVLIQAPIRIKDHTGEEGLESGWRRGGSSTCGGR